MALTRIDTGEAAKPLEQLQAINEDKHKELENSLLKEALAISNDKCNSLISEQNTLIEGLTSEVREVKQNNEKNVDTINNLMWLYKAELSRLVTDEREFKAKISQEITEAIRGTADEVTAYAKSQMDKSTEHIKRELAESVKEIRKQREDMKEQSLIRKIFFWATPAFLLIQTVLLAFALFA